MCEHSDSTHHTSSLSLYWAPSCPFHLGIPTHLQGLAPSLLPAESLPWRHSPFTSPWDELQNWRLSVALDLSWICFYYPFIRIYYVCDLVNSYCAGAGKLLCVAIVLVCFWRRPFPLHPAQWRIQSSVNTGGLHSPIPIAFHYSPGCRWLPGVASDHPVIFP